MKRCLAFFLLGFIAGCISLNLFLGNQIDRLYWEKEELRVRLFESNERLRKLEEQLQTHRNPTVNDVQIELEDVDKNSFMELSLREELGAITRDLVGEEIAEISPHLIRRLLDGRQIHLEESSTYEIKLNWVIIDEKTVINVSASHLEPSD